MAQKIKHLVALLCLAKSQFYYNLRILRVGSKELPQIPNGIWNLDNEEILHCSSDLFKSKTHRLLRSCYLSISLQPKSISVIRNPHRVAPRIY